MFQPVDHLHRKPDWCLSNQLLQPFQRARRAGTVSCGCQNAMLVLGSSISSHTDSHDEDISHGGPDSARYLRTTNCWKPTYLLLRVCTTGMLTYQAEAEPEEQHACCIAAWAGCEAVGSQRLGSPELTLCPSVLRVRTSARDSTYTFSNPLKMLYFSVTLTV